ncbi:MAG: hypothetical protein JRD43_00155 [Deltaproteobacteria bacterium]|nr:hypothetical protein [Deltaproteobacteria bacterium]MBW2594663.1 hypothetical protein [Deltaproteobacteria bacterium]MBW2649756.1 hypothetical protein [Deltaproteobacteria bacterium]
MNEYARTLTENDKIYDLVDVVEEGTERVLSIDARDDEITGVVSRIAERVAREMFPSIAEKVIREEINKLKEKYGDTSHINIDL